MKEKKDMGSFLLLYISYINEIYFFSNKKKKGRKIQRNNFQKLI